MAFNKVILVGNISNEIELKHTQSGVSVCSFSVAVSRRMAKNGEVDFITVQAWRQTAEFIAKYFKKGKPILVCGQLQTRTWTDNQGNKRYVTEVVADEVSFAGGNNDNATEAKPQPSAYTPSAYQTSQTQFEEVTEQEGLPFF